MAERLLEAVDRGMWSAPSAEALGALRHAMLEAEGWEEGGS
jgi:cobaltochelatase CobN